MNKKNDNLYKILKCLLFSTQQYHKFNDKIIYKHKSYELMSIYANLVNPINVNKFARYKI